MWIVYIFIGQWSYVSQEVLKNKGNAFGRSNLTARFGDFWYFDGYLATKVAIKNRKGKSICFEVELDQGAL